MDTPDHTISGKSEVDKCNFLFVTHQDSHLYRTTLTNAKNDVLTTPLGPVGRNCNVSAKLILEHRIHRTDNNIRQVEYICRHGLECLVFVRSSNDKYSFRHPLNQSLLSTRVRTRHQHRCRSTVRQNYSIDYYCRPDQM